MPAHPTFSRGHCFMTEPLNKPEVEEVGAMVAARLRDTKSAIRILETSTHDSAPITSFDPFGALILERRQEAKRLRAILAKMDYPEPEKP